MLGAGLGEVLVVIVSPGRLGGPCSPAGRLGVRCTWCPLLNLSDNCTAAYCLKFPMSPRVNSPTQKYSGQYKIAWAVHVSRRAPSRSSVRPVAALPGYVGNSALALTA